MSMIRLSFGGNQDSNDSIIRLNEYSFNFLNKFNGNLSGDDLLMKLFGLTVVLMEPAVSYKVCHVRTDCE